MVTMRNVLRGLAILALGWTLGVQSSNAQDVDDGPKIALGERALALQAEGQGCVNETELMRSDHMRFLFHHRDDAVLHGIRTKRYSLKECVSCHTSVDSRGEFIPINAEGQFCESCHEYASVSIDCFDCHATKPKRAY